MSHGNWPVKSHGMGRGDGAVSEPFEKSHFWEPEWKTDSSPICI